MATLQELNRQAIGFVEKETGKKFELKPDIRYGRNCTNSTRDKGPGTRLTKASVIIDKKLSKPKYRKLLKPIVIHEVRENLGFQHYENKQVSHREARKLEVKSMGNDKATLRELGRQFRKSAGYY